MAAIVEQIAEKIATRLKAIKKADGYSFDAIVRRPTRMGIVSPADGTVGLVWSGSLDRDDNSGGISGVIGWLTDFAIAVYVIASDKDESPVDTITSNRLADVIAALTNNSNTWGTFDGLAMESDITGATPFPEEAGDYSGCVITIQTQFQTPEHDFTQAVQEGD